MTTISLKLPDRLLRKIEKESRTRKTTRSALIRDSLERTFAPGGEKKQLSCYDLTWELIGSIKGAPHDLVTNPKYMEGYGE